MRIGLTGGIAEGKSTVMQMVVEHGVPIWSADAVVAGLWQRPDFVLNVGAALGLAGVPTKPVVRELIAKDASARRVLNQITHGEVIRDLLAADALVYEVPLLLEAGLQSLFAEIWVVTCGVDEQLRRLSERLGDEAQARRLIASQLSSRVRIAFADVQIRTNLALPSVRTDVSGCLARFGY